MQFTNVSGKFVSPSQTSHYVEGMTAGNEAATELNVQLTGDIPAYPDYSPTIMENIRHYFGSLWWLWIVAIVAVVFYFAKED